jgi:hypothetical protein
MSSKDPEAFDPRQFSLLMGSETRSRFELYSTILGQLEKLKSCDSIRQLSLGCRCSSKRIGTLISLLEGKPAMYVCGCSFAHRGIERASLLNGHHVGCLEELEMTKQSFLYRCQDILPHPSALEDVPTYLGTAQVDQGKSSTLFIGAHDSSSRYVSVSPKDFCEITTNWH